MLGDCIVDGTDTAEEVPTPALNPAPSPSPSPSPNEVLTEEKVASDTDDQAEKIDDEVGMEEKGASDTDKQTEKLDDEVQKVVEPQSETFVEVTSPNTSCGDCSSMSVRHNDKDDVEDFGGSPRDFLIVTAIAEEVKQFFGVARQTPSFASSSSSSFVGATTGAASSSSSMPASSSASSSSAPGTVYEVNVKLIDGTTTKLEMSSDMSGLDLKKLISDKMNVAIDRQRLISRGRVIQDADSVGQHITSSGQTIHLVQRPVPTGNESSQGTTSEQQFDGPQIRIQQTGGEVPFLAELSEILGASLGTVGRGVGMGAVLHATPLLRVPRPGQGATTAANGSNTPANSPPIVHTLGGSLGTSPLSSLLLAGANGTGAGNRQTPVSVAVPPARRGCLSKEALFVALLVTLLLIAMPMLAWCIVQIESTYVVGFPPWHIWALGFHLLGLLLGLPSVYLAFRSRSPLRGLQRLLAQTEGAGLDSNQTVLTQAIAAMTLQPQTQMVFSSNGLGLGSANVNVVTTVEAEGFPQGQDDAPEQQNNPQVFPWGITSPEAQTSNMFQPQQQQQQEPHNRSSSNIGPLPWQDLARFNEQATSLLGRSGANRQLPPAQMPHGELCSYLSVLQSATNQLGIGMGELQSNLLDGAGMPPDHLRNIAATLEAAARALSSTATAIQGEIRNGR